MKALPTCPIQSLATKSADAKWLIEDLWIDEGVGIIGGEPKCCKSFLALNIALSVSTGVTCIGQYQVKQTGKVLFYAAEDAPHILKGRIIELSKPLGIDLEALNIDAITVATLRLDMAEDQQKLRETIVQLRPKLLILDPFVRLHRIDENSSGEVAPILAYLRSLQREFQLAIIVVHHAKKSNGTIRAGQSLRGSSEFHAWGDVNLYLRRNREDHLNLSIEHRDGKSSSGINLELLEVANGISLRVIKKVAGDNREINITDRISTFLSQATVPQGFKEIRGHLGLRAEKVYKALQQMLLAGEIEKSEQGYQNSHSRSQIS